MVWTISKSPQPSQISRSQLRSTIQGSRLEQSMNRAYGTAGWPQQQEQQQEQLQEQQEQQEQHLSTSFPPPIVRDVRESKRRKMFDDRIEEQRQMIQQQSSTLMQQNERELFSINKVLSMSNLESNMNHLYREQMEQEEQAKANAQIMSSSPSSNYDIDEECPKKEKKVKVKPPKSEDENVLDEKKSRLPSSEEIYNRIKVRYTTIYCKSQLIYLIWLITITWEASMNTDVDDFTILYEDRFIGLMEVAFSKFELGAIPLHRVKSYKYKNNLIWDRPSRFMNFPAEFDNDN
ncbi:hypothetical protein PPL_04826 [Heterostelium album PN500]|uniref:MJ1316 RNA cyclic group end recognition domain-containing protein n=1 Tax=Heterostelium pallidum (strain ATCC 26659 / Pp 5 / PN500) TaxID=670386 RepID=D3B8N3_HETP5|nr:hypothetical protein PPL_04826 [Heterostelium album PN500]EFA82401.1 hypothetical protein PPL_04826 [Heterostelium album PN500]|eukprot:XP_020434518.1 hypothetical protein PPL_04826 [Heterostelium album PN500]